MGTEVQPLFVVEQTGGRVRLIRARNKEAAHRYVAERFMACRLASQADLERLIGAGIKPIDAHPVRVKEGDST